MNQSKQRQKYAFGRASLLSYCTIYIAAVIIGFSATIALAQLIVSVVSGLLAGVAVSLVVAHICGLVIVFNLNVMTMVLFKDMGQTMFSASTVDNHWSKTYLINNDSRAMLLAVVNRLMDFFIFQQQHASFSRAIHAASICGSLAVYSATQSVTQTNHYFWLNLLVQVAIWAPQMCVVALLHLQPPAFKGN